MPSGTSMRLGWLTKASLLSIAIGAGALAAMNCFDARPAQAQEEEDELKPAATAKATPTGAGNATIEESESMLVFFFRSLGWFYTIAFLFLSFFLVALIVMNTLAARREAVIPSALVQGFEQNLNEKRYKEAYELAKNDDSFLGHVLSAGLGKVSAGYPQAIEAMQEIGEEETMRLEHRLSYIALIGSISPMVGLLGTVDGMVASFMVIARSETQPRPPELAMGISTALITTLVGLWLAIPAIGVFGILRNRVQRLTLEVGVMSEQLMSRFQNVGLKK